MSRFCGKCDFYDHVGDWSDEKIANSEFRITLQDREHRLDINNQYDAALYYPYLVAIGAYDGKKSTIVLSSECFIDREEKEHIGWWVRDVLAELRRCKRKKIAFDPDTVYEKMNWHNWNNKQLRAVIDAIAKDGDKATFDHIHLNMHEYYRKTWYEYLVEIGYDKRKAFSWAYKEWLVDDEKMQERLTGG